MAASASNEIVVRHLFAASINTQKGLADWVAYRVLRNSVGVASLLPRLWQADALLDAPALQNSETNARFIQPDLSNQQDRDYRINEIIINPEERGRLAPMSSFANTPYWDELNYLSNMAPIPAALRIGSWSRLDQAINELAIREQQLFVISGPVYTIEGANSRQTALNSDRPIAYFKVVAIETNYAAFLFPQGLSQHSHYCGQLSSIERLQELSGLDFFPGRTLDEGDLQTQLGCITN